MRCYCESSLCDHEDMCDRPATGHVRMDYVGNTCTNCAANMCKSGGEHYIHLNEESNRERQ